MERFMRENLAGKWFCAFALSERTPDHSFFGDFRQRLGTKRLMDLFNRLRVGLKEAGPDPRGVYLCMPNRGQRVANVALLEVSHRHLAQP